MINSRFLNFIVFAAVLLVPLKSAAQVFDGQKVNAATTNAAFWKRNISDSAVGLYALQNVLASSGPFVNSIQTSINACDNFVGVAPNSSYNALPSWSNNFVGSFGDNVKSRTDALVNLFSGTGSIGHRHNGIDGQGPQITTGAIDANMHLPRANIAYNTPYAIVLDDMNGFPTSVLTGTSSGDVPTWNGSQWYSAPGGSLPPSGVTPGYYTNANITVTAQGVIVYAANGTGGGGGGGSFTPTNIQSFTTSGIWTVPANVTRVAVLVVGSGGGASGGDGTAREAGGGGGGGSVVFNDNVSVTPGTVIKVGVFAGGQGTTGGGNAAGCASPGRPSFFGGIMAQGGQEGMGFNCGGPTTARGNEGGDGRSGAGVVSQTQYNLQYSANNGLILSSTGYFNNGASYGDATYGFGGGGGGANGAGTAAIVASNAGGGGAGFTTVANGTIAAGCYGGGGGGGSANAGFPAGTATCGGGAGGLTAAGTAGAANTGGGGGGGATEPVGGTAFGGEAGGSGLVNVYWSVGGGGGGGGGGGVSTTALAVKHVSTTYIATLTDNFILADSSVTSFAVTLPTAASAFTGTSILLGVKKIDATTNSVTITASGGNTIDGVSTQVLNTPNEVLEFISDGSNWYVK